VGGAYSRIRALATPPVPDTRSLTRTLAHTRARSHARSLTHAHAHTRTQVLTNFSVTASFARFDPLGGGRRATFTDTFDTLSILSRNSLPQYLGAIVIFFGRSYDPRTYSPSTSFAVDAEGNALFYAVVTSQVYADDQYGQLGSLSVTPNTAYSFFVRRLDLGTGQGSTILNINFNVTGMADPLACLRQAGQIEMAIHQRAGSSTLLLSLPPAASPQYGRASSRAAVLRVDIASGNHSLVHIGDMVPFNSRVGSGTNSAASVWATAFAFDAAGGEALISLLPAAFASDPLLCEPGIFFRADMVSSSCVNVVLTRTTGIAHAQHLGGNGTCGCALPTQTHVLPLQLYTYGVGPNIAVDAPSGNLFLAEPWKCLISRIDRTTWTIAPLAGFSPVPVGGRGPSTPVCWTGPTDGPVAGTPIGAPGRMQVGSPGTLFFVQDGRYVRRVVTPAGRHD
jgi:hypothetical protein